MSETDSDAMPIDPASEGRDATLADAAAAGPVPIGEAQPQSGGGGGPTLAQGAWGLALVTLIVGAFMSLLDSSIVNVAVPTLETAFSATTAQIQWVITVYLLVLGIVVPSTGWLSDRFGTKRLYLVSLAIFTVGSFFSGFAWSVPVLILFRAFQAIGGGLIMPITMSMIYQLVPRNRIGSAMGFFGLALILGPVIGPTLGGYLVEYVNWRFIFYVNVPIGILGILAGMAYLPEFASRVAGRYDIPGAVTSAVGLFALLFALSEGSTWGWTSEGVVLLLYVAVVALILFVYIELHTERPLLDMRALSYGQFTLSLVIGAITSIALYSGVFYIPLFLQEVAGLGAFHTGLVLLPSSLVIALLMPVSGRLYDRVGPAPLAVVGLAIMTVTTLLFRNLAADTPSTTIILWMSMRSVGLGLAMMPVMTSGMTWIPTDEVTRASAISNIVQRVSASFGLAALTSLVTGWQGNFTSSYVASLNAGNALAMSLYREATALFGSATQAAALLVGLASRQAFVIAVDRLFVVGALIVLVGVVPSFFLRTNRAAGAATGRTGMPTPE
jgi:EmrB/QacA subfamily drug resistance transporter